MSDEKEILKDLLIDETEVQKNLAELVKKAKNIFQIQKETGQILFKNFGNLTNSARICALLMGKKFAKKLEMYVDDSMTITQISREFGIPSSTLSSPIADLVRKGFVLKSEKKYEIAYNRLSEIFDEFFGVKNEF